MVYFDQILHTNSFYHCPATGMQNGDEAAWSIQNVENCRKSQNLCQIEN